MILYSMIIQQQRVVWGDTWAATIDDERCAGYSTLARAIIPKVPPFGYVQYVRLAVKKCRLFFFFSFFGLEGLRYGTVPYGRT